MVKSKVHFISTDKSLILPSENSVGKTWVVPKLSSTFCIFAPLTGYAEKKRLK